MGSNFPRDNADEALLSFIHDFLKKRGFYKSAMQFKEEIEATMDGEVQLQPAVDSRDGFLYEWFGVFWDVFMIRFKSEVEGDKKTDEKAAANSSEQPPGDLQQPQQQQHPQHAQQLQAQQQKQQLQQPQLQQLQQQLQQQKQQPSQPGQHGQRSSQDFGKQNKKSANLGRDVINRRNDMMKGLDSAGGRMEQHRAFNGGQGSLSAGRQDTGPMGAPVGSVVGDHDLMGANSVGLNPKRPPPGRASNASSGHGSQDRRNPMMAEDESVSERSAQGLQRQKSGDPNFDGGLPPTEGSASAQRGAKKRTSSNKDKQNFKKGAGRNAAAAAVSAMAPGNSKPGRRPGSATDMESLRQFPNAYTAAAHAAARAAAEVGEELPRDAKPIKMTTQGLYYWHENEYKLWPGGMPVSSLPNDLGQEPAPPDPMYRKTQQWSNDRKQQWRNPAAEKASGKRTREEDVGLPRSTTDSVSSKSAFAQARAAIPRGMMMSESVESGGVADNAPSMGRGKPVGNKKKARGGGSQAWDGGLGDVAGSNAVPEHGRARGKQTGGRRGTGSQNTSADGMDGSRGQNKGQIDTQTMSGVGPDPSNGGGRVNPGDDLLFNYGNAINAGRTAAYAQNLEGTTATFLQTMGFDPKSVKKNGPDDNTVLENFFPPPSVEDSMQGIIGSYADSQTYKSDEISTLPRRNQ